MREYLVDLNATQAAKRAGYSEKYANRQASQLLTVPEVQDAISRAMKERSERTGITADYVLYGIRDVAERSMDPEGYDASAALRAFELLGKHLKLFTDKTETNLSGGLTIGWDNGTGDDSV